ncbi:hypothetical protein NHX12_033329 [Muraenolepis orangiensis]|uniref:deoxyhypusine monooxygenase n=1 Tax=Muraenolepis orangiensis TaxID=630683 RepID=A0A9Q0IJJ5_9TELE|nr:hypothetical protein NHX12_033329 [Muraenolepis orangiensis]
MATLVQIQAVGSVLADPSKDLSQRFRALFTLRDLGGAEAIEWISKTFVDDSALLKHELAYCLGQMQDKRAIPTLTAVLRDTQQDPMVRHEAGEALGAIGDPVVLPILEEYAKDPVVEVAETCQLALRRLEWLQSGGHAQDGVVDTNPYSSVDPAPPAPQKSIPELRAALLDETQPLFERYRAMFALRNDGREEAVLALGEGVCVCVCVRVRVCVCVQ